MPRGGARRGAGRKPKPKDERRSHLVSVYLTRSEYDRLAREAAAAGESLGSHLRRVFIRARRRKS